MNDNRSHMRCKSLRSSIAVLVLLIASFSIALSEGVTSDLRSLGFSVLPTPREARLSGRTVAVDSNWGVDPLVDAADISVRRLREGARELHGLEFNGESGAKIVLKISSGAVNQPSKPELARQAYRLQIASNAIEITGNGPAGLFYGIQTLLQLLRSNSRGQWLLPEGEIVDWPALELRFLHWDTKHHQDRMETLKRFIDWSAFFKANAIGFEIEDKYEFPRHPVVGSPGAFTKAQMQELTAYALERHIQLVPQIQAPAHMAYVLKHGEFKHLRSDGSNYQACMCDPEAIALIQDFYQDMIDATPGVDYFHVSTDEVYFAGICSKCQTERPYNEENRSQRWVEYVNTMHAWLAQRGRRMLAWVEYPLLTEHLERLPEGLINGVAVVGRGDAWNRGLKSAGVPSLAYCSIQGGELLFPNYFSSEFLDDGRPVTGRLQDPARSIPKLLADPNLELVGTYAAAWDDSGLHNETFWLGWATVSQYGWSPGGPHLEQSIADFMDIFYGPGNQGMTEIYRTLMEGARFYESSLDRVPARRLKPTYGSYAGKGRDTTRIDLTVHPPSLPFSYDETLITDRSYSQRYAPILAKAPEVEKRLDQAILALQGNLGQVPRNRYNLEVLLSIAYFEKHFVQMLRQLQKVEDLLTQASDDMRQERFEHLVSLLTQAHNLVQESLDQRGDMFRDLKATWEKSRFPKGQSAGGRDFVHVLDDLKDHRADRRAGLDYMLEPLENIGLEAWNRDLADYIKVFAKSRNLKVPDLGQ